MARPIKFEYHVTYYPKPTKDAQGNDTTGKPEVIAPITEVFAGSEKEVTMLAARGIPEKYLDQLEDVDISVRPF